jgi:endogenous inhibitor of DNA gyrase (YacG/DUF329 family)
MPIRHCQKCGLKVLIDESQSAVNPFYCQRCTAAIKQPAEEAPAAAEPSPAAPPELAAASAPRNATPVPAPSAVGAPARSSTVKVLCPYCKASFNGRIPQKPARGACPVCQKELILLPNGDIRPAAGFDVSRWQEEIKAPPPAPPKPEPEPVLGKVAEPTPVPLAGLSKMTEKESGTKLLIKKYAAPGGPPPAAPPKREPTPPPVPEPEPEPAPASPPAELPNWLDEAAPAAPPAPKKKPAITINPPEPAEVARDPGATELSDEPPPPLEAPKKPIATIRPATAVPPPKPEPAPARPSPRPLRSTDRRPLTSAAVSGATGGGKVFVAWILAILPLAACPALLSAREKLKGGPVEKIGVRFQKGFRSIYEKLVPPAGPPKPKPAEKKSDAPEEPAKPDAATKDELKRDCTDLYLKWKRDDRTFSQRSVGATDAEKAEFEATRKDLDARKDRIEQLRATIKRLFNEDFDPANP